jgi:hypothetical protein
MSFPKKTFLGIVYTYLPMLKIMLCRHAANMQGSKCLPDHTKRGRQVSINPRSLDWLDHGPYRVQYIRCSLQIDAAALVVSVVFVCTYSSALAIVLAKSDRFLPSAHRSESDCMHPFACLSIRSLSGFVWEKTLEILNHPLGSFHKNSRVLVVCIFWAMLQWDMQYVDIYNPCIT